jgi:hypothetical protein
VANRDGPPRPVCAQRAGPPPLGDRAPAVRYSSGPATLRHHDAVIGTLRGAGFSVAETAHAFALLDSYIYGFALSEAALPINGPRTVAEVAAAMVAKNPLDDYPHLAEFSMEHIMQPGYDFGSEFEFGLELILDGLARTIGEAGSSLSRR